MDPLTIGILVTVIMFLFILLGIHIAVVLSLMSVIGIWLTTDNFGASIKILSSTAVHGISDYVFSVIPLFVLMGLFSNLSGASKDLFNLFHVLLKSVRGGLGMATVAANAIFATITGVSVASAAVFSKIALPSMLELNYDKKLALGTIAGSSVLGMLIPPSLLMIIYGMIAEVSIGKLFMAGFIPGLLLAVIYCIGIYILTTLKPELIGGIQPKTKNQIAKNLFTKEDFKALITPWPVILLVIIILGGIYGGFMTPTEAGAIGAFGALLIAIFKRKLTLKSFWMSLIETSYINASILLLIISASMFSRMLSMTGLIQEVQQLVSQLNLSPTALIVVLLLILLLLGMILDSTSILLISMPLMLPLVHAVQYDLIVFGMLAIVAIEIGLLTPPFGLVVFSIKSSLGDTVNDREIFIGAFPFIIMMIFTLAILLIFPALITWLPSIMK